MWCWPFGCKDGWTPELTFKLGWDVKMRSTHEEWVSDIWVG